MNDNSNSNYGLIILVTVVVLMFTPLLTAITGDGFSAFLIALGLAMIPFLRPDSSYVQRTSYRKNDEVKLLTLTEADNLSGDEFEKFLVSLFQDLGYSAAKTKSSGDFGVDVIIEKEGRRIAIQAKRHKGRVGIAALYEAIGGMTYYEADEAWVITNSSYTHQAMNFAEKTGIRLIERRGLTQLIQERNQIMKNRARQKAI